MNVYRITGWSPGYHGTGEAIVLADTIDQAKTLIVSENHIEGRVYMTSGIGEVELTAPNLWTVEELVGAQVALAYDGSCC